MRTHLPPRIALLFFAVAIAAFLALPQSDPSRSLQGPTAVQETDAAIAALFAGEPTSVRAMFEVYGSSPSSNHVFKGTATKEFAKLKFQHGSQQMLTILLKSKLMDPPSGTLMECHACGVSLSAIDYAYKDGAWTKVSQSLDFTEVGSWGDADADAGDMKQASQELTKASTSFLLESGGSGQGYTSNGKYILTYESSQWKSNGYITTAEDSAGNCEEAPDPKYPDYPLSRCWQNSGALEVLATSTNAYKDIAVRMKGTIAGSGDSIIPAKDVVYKMAQRGEYEPLSKRREKTQ